MQYLRPNALPPKVAQMRSLSESVRAALNVRTALLSQFSGYPSPANLLASVRKFFKLDNINDLRQGILELRDAVRYASQLLVNLPFLRVDRHQLQLNELYKYVEAHAQEYGYPHLAGRQNVLFFIAYLITGTEPPETSWLLDAPNDESNMFIKLSKLYRSLDVDATNYTVVRDTTTNKITVTPSGAAQIKYYVPASDDLQNLSEIAFPIDMKDFKEEEIAKTASEEKREQITSNIALMLHNESKIYAIANIRFVDHIFALLMDTDIWSTFVTPRKDVQPSGNEERSKGLALFSAYLQSLLIYPHVFRYEVFQASYLSMEEWNGTMPTLPAEISANYEKYIREYDFFDAKADVTGLFNHFTESNDPNLRTKIFPQFKEIVHFYGMEQEIAALAAMPKISSIKIERLQELQRKELDHILLSYPLKPYRLNQKVLTTIVEKRKFVTVTESTYTFLMPAYARFFSAPIKESLHKLTFRPLMPLHATIAASASWNRGYAPRFQTGKFGHRYCAVFSTAETNYALRNDELWQVALASSLNAKYDLTYVAVDLDTAKELRSRYSREWKTMYPSNLINGEKMIEPDAYAVGSDSLELRSLFESISGQHYTTISRELTNDAFAKIWATYLSSCALLFKDTGGGSFVNIAGDGLPYGVDYNTLLNMQDIDYSKDLIKLPSVNAIDEEQVQLFIAFLKKVPLPSATLKVGTFGVGTPYYYFSGNGDTLSVKRFVHEEGLLHMALRPVDKLPSVPEKWYLFDKFYAYSNDTLFIQANAHQAYDTVLDPNEVTSVSLGTRDWKGELTTTFLKFITFSAGYGTSSHRVAATDASGESSEVTKLIKELEKDTKEAASHTPVFGAPVTGDPGQIESEIAAGVNKSSSKGGKKQKDDKEDVSHDTGNITHGNKKKKDDDLETTPTVGDTPSKSAKKAIFTFKSVKTGKSIEVFPKEGESDDAAIARVKKDHNTP